MADERCSTAERGEDSQCSVGDTGSEWGTLGVSGGHWEWVGDTGSGWGTLGVSGGHWE